VTDSPHAATASGGRRGIRAEFKDAITVRATLLVFGVGLLQLGFIASYIGAFHQPTPHSLPLAVVAPAGVSAKAVSGLNAVAGTPVRATAVGTVAAGERKLLDRTAYGVLVVDPAGTTDHLVEASAGGVSAAVAMTEVMQLVERHVHRTIRVQDIRPPLPGDRNSLSSFYLVIGWIVGGYLVAAILGVSAGSRPANANRATVRLAAIAVYAVVTGLAGALIAGPWMHALPSHVLGLWMLGALLVFSAGAFSMGLQVVAGTIGIGLSILIFVVIGNPSAGGAYSWPLLPTFWRLVGPWVPSGAGTSAARGIAYFESTGIGSNLLVIAAYGVAGIVLIYVVLVDIGHQLDRLPSWARSDGVEAADDASDADDASPVE
jgi:hypothetical protein